jgi:hypothetical protein
VFLLSNSTSYILLNKVIDSFAYCPLSKNLGGPILGLDKACPRRQESRRMDARPRGPDHLIESPFLLPEQEFPGQMYAIINISHR